MHRHGETGLDYHYTAERRLQQDSLRVHIQAARQTGLPLIHPCPRRDDDMARILTENTARGPLYLRHALLFLQRGNWPAPP